jgi:hypothetical protein
LLITAAGYGQRRSETMNLVKPRKMPVARRRKKIAKRVLGRGLSDLERDTKVIPIPVPLKGR